MGRVNTYTLRYTDKTKIINFLIHFFRLFTGKTVFSINCSFMANKVENNLILNCVILVSIMHNFLCVALTLFIHISLKRFHRAVLVSTRLSCCKREENSRYKILRMFISFKVTLSCLSEQIRFTNFDI